MLVLSRHRDESLMIGDDVAIVVVDIRGDKVRLGIDAPPDVAVHRREVYDAIQRHGQAKADPTPMVYLATPYTHADPLVMDARFKEAARIASSLMNNGVHLFAPITHTHPIAIAGDGLPRGFDFWERYDRWFLQRCDELWIVTMDGWLESKGIAAERRMAVEYGKPVKFVDPVTLKVSGLTSKEQSA